MTRERPTEIDERKRFTAPLAFFAAIVALAVGGATVYASITNRLENVSAAVDERRVIDANQDERIRQLEIAVAKLSDIKDTVNRTADAVNRIEKRMGPGPDRLGINP